ncbi:MAG: DUF72 domain-containing protein [Bacteroidota bacterium]
MKFGKVDQPELIDFTLPPDHPDTAGILAKGTTPLSTAYVGCAKWNRADLKGFYPRGTKDELSYYSTQFNSIELNATFYNLYGEEQIKTWCDKTPETFRFFPKVNQRVSHFGRLKNVDALVDDIANSMRAFGDRMGMMFLQLHNNFGPKDMARVRRFAEIWPKDIPLAVELRHTDWFNDEVVANEIYQLFEQHNIANIITDTAGRRDLLHMRLTTPIAFIRYVGANHESDYPRLDHWLERILEWKEQGLEQLYFFVHQNTEKESPLLSTYFIEKLNKATGFSVVFPHKAEEQGSLGI